METPDLSTRFRSISERYAMVRADLGYGRKASKTTFAALAQAGPVSFHHYDDASGLTTIERFQDVAPILEANQADFTSGHDGYTPTRNMRRVASIPLIVVEQLYKRGINVFDNNDWPKVAAILDSQEFQKFRTAPGTISRRRPRETFVPARSRMNRRRHVRIIT